MGDSKRDKALWGAALGDALGLGNVPPGYPDGWYTLKEVRKLWDVGECKSQKMMRTLLDSGKAIRHDGSYLADSGKYRKRTWYKLKEKNG